MLRAACLLLMISAIALSGCGYPETPESTLMKLPPNLAMTIRRSESQQPGERTITAGLSRPVSDEELIQLSKELRLRESSVEEERTVIRFLISDGSGADVLLATAEFTTHLTLSRMERSDR